MGTKSATPASTPVTEILVGDSLAAESERPFIAELTARGRAVVETETMAGSALRDWLQPQFLPTEVARFGAVLRDGLYTDDLPCLPTEVCAQSGFARGLSRVRAPDGVHFCPVVHVYACPVYSSGAQRFGAATAAPLVARYNL